jgi:hypothetical protein
VTGSVVVNWRAQAGVDPCILPSDGEMIRILRDPAQGEGIMKTVEQGAASGLLAWKKWSVAAALLVAGYIVYTLTQGQAGFFPELLHHVGLFISAVVAVHFIYELLVKRDDQAELRREVAGAVATTISAVMPAFEKWGFQGFQDDLKFAEVFDHLEDGDELLWLDTYAPSRDVVINGLTSALARGVKIRMLAIAPDSATAKMRAAEINQPGFSEKTFLGDLSSFINELHDLAKAQDKKGLFELRLYQDLPCVPMYIHRRGDIPYRGFTGYFLSNASERFAHIRWTFADRGMLSYFSEYFDDKWERARFGVVADRIAENAA